MANANHLITFTQGAKSNAANGGIQPGNIAAPGKNSNTASFAVHVGHKSLLFPFLILLLSHIRMYFVLWRKPLRFFN
jgi:hypothetical protein